MIAYKGFDRGLVCRGYQFHMGKNVTDKANCRANGFHCAENPLDCLTYYPNMAVSEYYLVDAGGDVDEDSGDSKIACTELTIIKKLDLHDFLLHALAYMVDHPLLPWNSHVQMKRGTASQGFVIVRGTSPAAKGRQGDLLAFAKEAPNGRSILQIALASVDGKNMMPDTWYGIDMKEKG